MKRLVLAALLASGCRIGDITFTPLAGDGDDASVDDSLKLIDAPPNLQPMTRGFMAFTGGLWSLTKAANGDLAPAQPTPFQAGNGTTMAVATNRTGTHVYVGNESAAAGSEVRDMVFQGSALVSSTGRGLGCGPRQIVVHPSHANLVVACSQGSGQVYFVELDPVTHAIRPTPPLPIANTATIERRVAITPDGACLYVTDLVGNGTRLLGYSYSAASNAYTAGPQSQVGPSGAVDLVMHPNGRFLYLIAGQAVQAYAVQTGCGAVFVGVGVATGMQAPRAGQVDPQGGRLFVIGDRIAPFNIMGDGQIAQIPGAINLTGNHLAGVFDPAVPNTMYTTSQSYEGVFQTEIDMGGAIVGSQGFMSQGSTITDFVLAP